MGESIAILYHSDMDGQVAAWVAINYLDSEPGADIHTFPVQYEVPLPEEFTSRQWSAIYILDFSLEPEVFDKMLEAHDGKLVMLDHHKSAAKKYGEHWKVDGLGEGDSIDPYIWAPDDDTKVVFHIGVAGCTMTEYYFQAQYGDEPSHEVSLPELVRYAADHDLWKFELPHSEEIRAAFRSYPMNLATCKMLADELQAAPGHLVEEGRAILRFKQQIVDTAVRHAEWVEMNGVRGLAAEMPVAGLISDVAGRLAEQEGAAFGCCWFKVSGKDDWVYSLRSRGDFDVSELASKMGGGGHAKAAGFNTLFNPFEFLTGEKFKPETVDQK